MSQPYPPPYPSRPSGWSDPRAAVPEQTHLQGGWAPQPGAVSHPSLPQQPYPPYAQNPYAQDPYAAPPAYGQGYPQQPAPYGSAYPGAHPPPPPSNGMGITALVLALIGLFLSWIPFVGILSVLLGLAAIVFGLVGWNRARQGRATLTLPVVGAAIGIVAIVIGIVSTTVAVRVIGDAADDIAAAPSAGLPAAPGLPDPSPAPSASTPDEDTAAVPATFDWDDGVSVEVGAAQAVTFSDTSTATGATGVSFPVRIINNSTEVLEPYTLFTSLTANGAPADQVFDYGDGNFTAPSNSIPPGRELTYTIAFDAAGGDLLLEVSSFDRDAAFFTATL